MNHDDQLKALEVLVHKRVITWAQFRQVRDRWEATGESPFTIIGALGLATEEMVTLAFAKSLGLSYFDFRKHKVSPDAVALVPMDVLRTLRAMPVHQQMGMVYVAICDPDIVSNIAEKLSEASGRSDLTFKPVLAMKSGLDAALADGPDKFLRRTVTRLPRYSGDALPRFPDETSQPTALTGKTRVLAVWGHPVSHSRSPAMHNAALTALGLDWVYVPFDVAPGDLDKAVSGLRAMCFAGVNCTVPLKERVGEWLDAIDDEAAKVGSVNTIVVHKNGSLVGCSTDGRGFLWDLKQRDVPVDNHDVLIWGAGGSSRAIAYALSRRGCRVTIANRTLERAQDVATLCGGQATGLHGDNYEKALRNAHLLVNTTTLGMSSNETMPPLPEGLPRAEQVVYDIVYTPPRTPLLRRAEEAGCRAINGLGMLACQGALSLALWTGMPASEMPLDIMLNAIAE
jgi:shikimate dehydrogenase